MAPTRQAARSAPVLAMTRAVKVEALKPWSIVATRYCSTARASRAVGSLARHHAQVVLGVTEARVRRDGLEALVQPVGRGEDRRRDRDRGHGGGELLVLVAVVEGPQAGDAAPRGQGGAQHLERVGRRRADGGQQVGEAGRHDAEAPDRRGERRELAGVGEVAVEEQVPRLLEADLLGQLDGGVLAVVEEALVAADVAELGVGDDDLGQALGDRDETAGVGGHVVLLSGSLVTLSDVDQHRQC